MSKIIVGIHGLSNKPKKATLEQWWKKSIREGLAKNRDRPDLDFAFHMVYWADLLYQYPMHRESGFEFDELYNDEPYIPADEAQLKTYHDGMLDEIRRVGGSAFGWVTDRLHETETFDRFADWVVGKVVRDLDFYYDKDRRIRDRAGEMRVARRVLMDELQNELLAVEEQTLMLIAHSMGSIIAYDVLRDIGRLDRRFRVADFVTIGSPLGLGLVKANVEKERTYDEEGKRLRAPTVVENWVNYADKKDPVSSDPHLSDDYGPNARNVKVRDDLVCNDYRALKRTGEPAQRNHHKSYGYLRTPELSAHVEEFLRRREG